MFRTVLRAVCVVALLEPSFGEGRSDTNLREFYLQLGGIGPTAGESTSSASTQWALNTSWASRFLTVSADWDVSSASIREARALGWSVTLTTHGSPRWRQRTHATNPSKPLENLTTAMASLAAADLEGDEVLLEYICEDDSAGVGFPQDLLKMARAAGYSNGATKLRPKDAQAGWLAYLQEAQAAIASWPSAHRNSRVGWPSSVHSVAPVSDLVQVELTNDDVGSLAPALAFLRGAASQFGIRWGIDLSEWWGVIYGCVNDLPSSLHARAMALAYVAGASLVAVEGCGYIDPATGRPYPIAHEVDRFGKLVSAQDGAKGGLPPSQRGTPDAAVALILPPDLGWSERPSWSAAAPTLWSYANIPVASMPGAAAVDGLLSAAYPGAGGAFGFLAFPFGTFAP